MKLFLKGKESNLRRNLYCVAGSKRFVVVVVVIIICVSVCELNRVGTFILGEER
jgi:hypothetical protein